MLDFFELHGKYKHSGLNKKHIVFEDVQGVLQGINCSDIDVVQIANSYEGRPINLVTIGRGATKVFAWSQMHGDEPTATSSLLDLLLFIQCDNGRRWYNEWRDNITLHIVPMLNPDGAAAVTRENAQGIDINRDAIVLQTPEGRILSKLMDDLRPNLAFNLHDQNPYYTAGENGAKTLVAFMAPPPDEQKTITTARRHAMQLIGSSVELITPRFLGKIARYDDTYSSSSFGDLAATKNIPCILIESGYDPADSNRQMPRMINFVALCHALSLLSASSDISGKENIYNDLPMNVEGDITD